MSHLTTIMHEVGKLHARGQCGQTGWMQVLPLEDSLQTCSTESKRLQDNDRLNSWVKSPFAIIVPHRQFNRKVMYTEKKKVLDLLGNQFSL